MKNFKFKWLLLSFILSIASINTMWATARTFKSGEKIYFKDTWKANGNSSTWKVDNSGSGTLCAYFYGDGDGWYKCYGSDNKYGEWNAANTIYEITVPGTGKNFTHVVFTRGTNDPYNSNKWSGCWNKTLPQAPEESYNIFYVANTTKKDDNEDKYEGTWGRYAHDGALIGQFNNWNPDTYPLSNSGVKGTLVPLAASTTYKFKILLGETYYGINSASLITSTLTNWWTLFSGQGDLSVRTDVAGDYGFAWNASSKNMTVYYPKALYPKNKYIYFDVRNETYWNANPFTARFYLKYFDTGSNLAGMPLECSTPIEDNVYYAVVPDNGYIGQIQMNRWYNNALDGIANIAYVYDRGSANENCLKEESGKENEKESWTPQWTIYCPPTQSETFANNGTTVISWTTGNGTSGNPYLVKTGTAIKATASATKSVADGDMTINYDFKVNGTSRQAGTSNTFSYAASTNNTAYNVTMDAYTVYNLDGTSNSTKHTHATTLYYKALDTYSVTNTLTNISSNGRSGSDAAAYNIAYTATLSVGTGYTLPATITVKRGEITLTASTHYTYNSTTGALSINADQVTGALTIIAAGVAKTYTEADNLDKNGGDAHGKYTATYDATKIAINTTPTKANYHVEGYYLETGCTNKIADASGNLVANIEKDAVAYTDGSGKWKQDASVKLYTKWEENSFTVTIDNGEHGTASVSEITGHPLTSSASFSITPAAGWAWDGWTISPEGQATVTKTESTTSATTFTLTATANVTITPIYSIRYALFGSLESSDDPGYGMPGWAPNPASGFTYSESTYTLELNLTKPNSIYKFRILDGRTNTSWGLASSAVIAEKTSTTLGSTAADAKLATAGRGTYTLTVVEADGGTHPQVTITNPTSYLVTLGVKSVLIDGTDAGALGGTVTAKDAAGNTYTSGQYIANGETVTVEATDIPTGYHFVGWWSSSAYSGEPFATINPKSWSVVEPVNAYAKFTENTKEAASGDGNWSTKVGASTLTDVVIISSTITVDEDHALAKRVILDQSGGGKAGKLVISANKGLEVAEGILINNGTSLVAPTASDLVLESSASGNATLIFNNSNSAAATVGMYSIASVVESTWNWQYIASPYVTANALHNYYGSYLYRWGNGDGTTTGWFAVPNGGSVNPFVAYCITNTTAGTYYQMEGTMVATDGNDQTISVPAGKSWVVGNSWTAPIQIGQLQDADFTGLLKNVYLYNTGMDESGAALEVANPTGTDRYAANTYVSIPIHSALYTDISVVSSLQGFYVKDDPSVAGGGTLKLNYTNHVRPSGGNSIQNDAMHAPKRIVADENEPNVLKIKVCGSKYDDRLVLLERADFSMGYDAGWDGDKMGNVAASPRITVEREDGTSDAVSAVPDLEGLAINFRAANTDNQQTLYFEYSDDINPLYIVDVTNNEYTRVLTGNSYTFSTSDNEEHPRFILTRYGAPQITTGVDEVYNANSARKQMINGTLYIIRDGRIYNAEGALVK